MQTHHQDTGRIASGFQLGIGIAQKRDQFIVNNLHDLLARLDAGHHFLPKGLLLYLP